MDSNHVRGTMNTILYGVMFERALTDDVAERLAGFVAEDERSNRFREAIAIVLREGRLPEQTLELCRQHSEAALLDLLTRVSARLADR